MQLYNAYKVIKTTITPKINLQKFAHQYIQVQHGANFIAKTHLMMIYMKLFLYDEYSYLFY